MRVLVTRARGDAERTAKALAARGHEAVLAPVTEIVATGEPIPAGAYDAILVTSAHAAEALAAIPDKRKPVFAVGSRSAEAAQEAGFSCVLAGQGDAGSLSGLIRGGLRPGLALLHVAARHRKEEPAASLRAAGFAVLPWEAYEARAARSLPGPAIEALRTGQIGAALHYSRRSADLFVRLAEQAGLAFAVRTVPHLCLSADVAAPLEALGAVSLTAEEPSEDALLGLLEGLP
jgi:uroporphyrinogen-III synthase